MRAPTSSHPRALFLCATPLQARICLKIMETEGIFKPDVLYFTQNDSKTDRLYFSRLEGLARNAQYLMIRKQRFDILNHMKAYWGTHAVFKKERYQQVYLANFLNLHFRMLVENQKMTELYTFDDGTSNIIENGIFSFHVDDDHGKLKVYSRFASLKSPKELKERSVAHYSIYRNFKNICRPEKIRFLSIFSDFPSIKEKGKSCSFFIGQPFHEYLSAEKIQRLETFLKNNHFDFYVPHPRETNPSTWSIPILEKNGELAEMAIIKESNDRIAEIYSCFSTVLFNIPAESANKHYLHFSGEIADQEMLELAKQAGCNIIEI